MGEVNDRQQASWCKTAAVFDEQKQQFTELSLFAGDSIQVKLSGPELRRPRPFGNGHKEVDMRRKRLARLLRKRRVMRRSLPGTAV